MGTKSWGRVEDEGGVGERKTTRRETRNPAAAQRRQQKRWRTGEKRIAGCLKASVATAPSSAVDGRNAAGV